MSDYEIAAARTDLKDLSKARIALATDESLHMLNAIMGLAGEAGELLDYFKKVIFQGKPLDHHHLLEELGDNQWYAAKLTRILDTTLEVAQQMNIAKLKDRYPEGFDAERSEKREAAATADLPSDTAAAKTKRGKEWMEFSKIVLDHIENYTVPQYGDAGQDLATEYLAEKCFQEIEKYLKRRHTNQRPDQFLKDPLKMAHYLCLAFMKLHEEKVEKPRPGRFLPEDLLYLSAKY